VKKFHKLNLSIEGQIFQIIFDVMEFFRYMAISTINVLGKLLNKEEIV